MRKQYEMTPEQNEKLLAACQSVPMIMLHIGGSRSPQQRANDAWESLGKELGFNYNTAQPVPGKPSTFFTAEPLTEDTQ